MKNDVNFVFLIMSKSFHLKEAVQDIRFWIGVLFVLRLYGVWFPPIEVEHNWRMTTVTMVARNFYEIDNNIFYPRLDFAGQLSGITGMEFPLLNYLIYLFSELFTYTHWYGRLINLVVSSIGVWYFFKLIREQFNERTAFYASFLLLSSLWFAYSRKAMPDTFATSLAIIGIYNGLKYLSSHNFVRLIKYVLFALLGMLSKLPVVFLFFYFLIPFFSGRLFTRQKILFALGNLFVVVPVGWWYFYWAPYLTEQFGFWHFFMGKSFLVGLKELSEAPLLTLKNLFFTPLKISGLVLFIVSIVWLSVKQYWKPLVVYSLGLFAFFWVVCAKSGWTFYHHNYYCLTYVPVFVVPLAVFLDHLKYKKIVTLLLTAALVEGITSQMHEFRVKDDRRFVLELNESLSEIGVKKDELIAFNSGPYPTPMYFAERKGWVCSSSELYSPVIVQTMRNYGCKYIVVLSHAFGENIKLPYKVFHQNSDFTVYHTPPKPR